MASTYKKLWDAAPFLVIFVGLVVFVCFEAVQVVRGRVHLRGIARAAFELLIASPVIVLLIVVTGKIAGWFGLNHLEATVFRRWVTVTILSLIWISWAHYRAKVKPVRKLGSARGEFTVPDDFNDPLPKEIEDEFYK